MDPSPEPATHRSPLKKLFLRPRLQLELQQASADLICLQEVQFNLDAAGEFVAPLWLQLPGYLCFTADQAALKVIYKHHFTQVLHCV